jgi:hypothetical protein
MGFPATRRIGDDCSITAYEGDKIDEIGEKEDYFSGVPT